MSGTEDRHAALLRELESARARFVAAVADVEPDLFAAPGLMEDWSARDLVEHVASWSDHGADALESAVEGRGAEFDYDTADTDAINAGIAKRAQALAPEAVLEHERAAYRRFRERLAGLDPALLDLVLGNGDTVAEVVRYDGPEHYAQHTEHIRAWFSGQPEPEDDE